MSGVFNDPSPLVGGVEQTTDPVYISDQSGYGPFGGGNPTDVTASSGSGSFVERGGLAWVQNRQYILGDVVSFHPNGIATPQLYVAITASPDVSMNPSVNETDWFDVTENASLYALVENDQMYQLTQNGEVISEVPVGADEIVAETIDGLVFVALARDEEVLSDALETKMSVEVQPHTGNLLSWLAEGGRLILNPTGLATALAAKQDTLTGIADVPGLIDALNDKLSGVTTDSTLQGTGTASDPLSVVAGGSGISSVVSDDTLEGTGVAGNPLSVHKGILGAGTTDDFISGIDLDTKFAEIETEINDRIAHVATDNTITGNGETDDPLGVSASHVIGGPLSITATPNKVAEIGIYAPDSTLIGQQFVISTVDTVDDIQDININSEPASGTSTTTLAQRLEITLNKATAIADGDLRVPTTQAVLDYVTSIETDPVTVAAVRAVLQDDTGVGGISWSIDSGTGDIIGVANIASKADIATTVIDTDIILDTHGEITHINVGGTQRDIANTAITAPALLGVTENNTGDREVQFSVNPDTNHLRAIANSDSTKADAATNISDSDIIIDAEDQVSAIRVAGNVHAIASSGETGGQTAAQVQLAITGRLDDGTGTSTNDDNAYTTTEVDRLIANIDTGGATETEAANATVWQEDLRDLYAQAANVIDLDPSKAYTTARDYIKLPTGVTSPIVRPSEDTYTSSGLIGTSWVRVPIVGSPWVTNREYIVGDQIYTEREGGVVESVICTEEHVSSADTDPADTEHVNYTTNGSSLSAKPWRPITAAISVRTAITVPDPTPFEGDTGTDLEIVATILGVGINAGRFGVRLGTDGSTPVSITGDNLPQIGTTWRFGSSYDVSTPLYTLESIVQDSAAVTTFYFGGATPSSISLGADHIWQVIEVEEFGQTDTLLFNQEQFKLMQASGGVTEIAISTPGLRFAGRTEFLESLLAPTGDTISVSGETLTYTPSGGAAVEIDFDEFLHPVSSTIDQDVNAILIASGFGHGNTIYIDSQDAFFYVAQSGGHFHLVELATTDALATETAAREAADTTLQDNINTEATTRAEDDAIEALARIDGDEAERDFVEDTLHVNPADSQSYYQFSGKPAIFSEVPGTDYGITVAMPETITDVESLVQAEAIPDGPAARSFKLRLRFNDGANDTKEYIVTTHGSSFTISDETSSETFGLPTIPGTWSAGSVFLNGTNTLRQNCFLAIGGWSGQFAQIDMAHILSDSDGSILAGRELEEAQDYSRHVILGNNNTTVVGIVFDNLQPGDHQATGITSPHYGINAYLLQRNQPPVRYRALNANDVLSFRNASTGANFLDGYRVPNREESIRTPNIGGLGMEMVTIQAAISGTSANGGTDRTSFAVGDRALVVYGDALNSTSAGITVPGIAFGRNVSVSEPAGDNFRMFVVGGEDPSEEYSNYVGSGSSSNEADFNATIYGMSYNNSASDGVWRFFFGGNSNEGTSVATRAAGFAGGNPWNMISMDDAAKAAAGGTIYSVTTGGDVNGVATNLHSWVTTELGALWITTTPWQASGYSDAALQQAHVNPNDPTSDTKRDFIFRGFQYFDQHQSIGIGDDNHIYRLIINPEVTFTVTFGNVTHTATYRFNDDTAAMHTFFGNPASYSPTLVGSGVSLITTQPSGEPADQRYLDYSVNGQNTPVVSYQWVGVLRTGDTAFTTYNPFRRIDLANTVVDIHYPDGGATYHIALSSVASVYPAGGEANEAVDQIVTAVNTHTAQGHSAVRVDGQFADTITNTRPVLRLDQEGTHALQNAPEITIAHPSGQNTGDLSVESFADGGYDTIGRPGGLFDPNNYDTRAETDAKIAAIASTHGYAENIVANAGDTSTIYPDLDRLQIGTEIYDVRQGLQGALDTDQLAVVNADPFTSANYTQTSASIIDTDIGLNDDDEVVSIQIGDDVRQIASGSGGFTLPYVNDVAQDADTGVISTAGGNTYEPQTVNGLGNNFRYALLLTNGFLLTPGTSTTAREAYVDTNGAYGAANTTYYFDATANGWFDVDTGGTALISFPT